MVLKAHHEALPGASACQLNGQNALLWTYTGVGKRGSSRAVTS